MESNGTAPQPSLVVTPARLARCAGAPLQHFLYTRPFWRDIRSHYKLNMPSIGNFRTIGSKAFVHITEERRDTSDKLVKRCWEGVLIGHVGDRIYSV